VMSGNRSLHLASVGMLAGAAYIILGLIPARAPSLIMVPLVVMLGLGAFGNEGQIQMKASELESTLRSGGTSARVLLPTWTGALCFLSRSASCPPVWATPSTSWMVFGVILFVGGMLIPIVFSRVNAKLTQ